MQYKRLKQKHFKKRFKNTSNNNNKSEEYLLVIGVVRVQGRVILDVNEAEACLLSNYLFVFVMVHTK